MKLKIFVDGCFVRSCQEEHFDSVLDDLSFEFDFGDGSEQCWAPDEHGRIFLETVWSSED